jgi:hypothetical protein
MPVRLGMAAVRIVPRLHGVMEAALVRCPPGTRDVHFRDANGTPDARVFFAEKRKTSGISPPEEHTRHGAPSVPAKKSGGFVRIAMVVHPFPQSWRIR